MVCAQGGQVVCDAALAEAVLAEWRAMAAAALAAGRHATIGEVAAENGLCAAAEGSWSKHNASQTTISPFQVAFPGKIVTSGTAAATAAGSGDTQAAAAVAASAAWQGGGLQAAAGGGVTASGRPVTSLRTPSAPLPKLAEHSDGLAASAAVATAAPAYQPGAAGSGSVPTSSWGDAFLGARGAAAVHSHPVSPGVKRAASELPRSHQLYSMPASNALHAVASAPDTTTLAASSAAVGKASAPGSPAASGFTSWLASGNKASFGQLRGAGPRKSVGSKSVGGRGLRLAHRMQQRPTALVLAPAPSEVPCAVCVPPLPGELFGEQQVVQQPLYCILLPWSMYCL